MRVLWEGFSYKQHQTVGVTWMLQREKDPTGPGGIVCDEMGLGKTIETLGLIKNQSPGQRSLLLAPVAVLEQWAKTAERANIQVWLPHKTEPVWIATGTVSRFRPQLYIASYELARCRSPLLEAPGGVWDRIVCDEAHRLAGGNLNTEMVRKIVCSVRWFLTATPIVNGMKDLYALLALLGYERTALASQEERNAVIHDCVMARTMEQLRATMPDAPPPPQFVKHLLPFLTEDEREFYTGIQGMLTKRFRVAKEEKLGAFARFQLLMRLRQLSLHPQVYISARKRIWGAAYRRPDWVGTSTKFAKIHELLEAGSAESHKWIVFCHFHSEMEMLRDSLRTLPFVRHVGIYSGAENATQREKVLAESREPAQEGKTDVILIQLQAGGVGLNLQHCDRIMFTGPWWTSALMEQAIGRAVRIGQKAVVEVHHLFLKEEEGMNIDRVMVAKATAKGKMCRKVLAAAFNTV
jgi:SNF2 family DNA or RNA helicase